MIPTIGRIVHYRLNSNDVEQIKFDRQAPGRRGNEVREGDTFPMMITQVWGNTETSAVNGQVMLDGNDIHWATSVCAGEGPRTFSWPTRT